ncbi:hypothetical protein T484DRAFT_1825943 [Baffinella frigidus]|nr:hypothetical protein T484DRAFT_1825943 [Cryptophyta sp. CCMP2293]
MSVKHASIPLTPPSPEGNGVFLPSSQASVVLLDSPEGSSQLEPSQPGTHSQLPKSVHHPLWLQCLPVSQWVPQPSPYMSAKHVSVASPPPSFSRCFETVGVMQRHVVLLAFLCVVTSVAASPSPTPAPKNSTYPAWLSSDPATTACSLNATWPDLLARSRTGTGASWKTGGLGGLMDKPRFQVWLCEEGHACANGTSLHFCFVFDEEEKVFVPWGPDSLLQLGKHHNGGTLQNKHHHSGSLALYDKHNHSGCRALYHKHHHTTSSALYLWESNGALRLFAERAVPVPGYTGGIPTFSTVDISAIISTNSKYRGGVLAANRKIVFIPNYANNVGLFDTVSNAFSTVDPKP